MFRLVLLFVYKTLAEEDQSRAAWAADSAIRIGVSRSTDDRASLVPRNLRLITDPLHLFGRPAHVPRQCRCRASAWRVGPTRMPLACYTILRSRQTRFRSGRRSAPNGVRFQPRRRYLRSRLMLGDTRRQGGTASCCQREGIAASRVAVRSTRARTRPASVRSLVPPRRQRRSRASDSVSP
jgi:hypothetical protein